MNKFTDQNYMETILAENKKLNTRIDFLERENQILQEQNDSLKRENDAYYDNSNTPKTYNEKEIKILEDKSFRIEQRIQKLSNKQDEQLLEDHEIVQLDDLIKERRLIYLKKLNYK